MIKIYGQKTSIIRDILPMLIPCLLLLGLFILIATQLGGGYDPWPDLITR